MDYLSKKRFGQHFLHDPHILDKIVYVLVLKSTDHIVEIGPGLGALTEKLLLHADLVEAIELDRDIIPRLKQRFHEKNNFIIHEGDALKFDYRRVVQFAKKIRVVGNLPYNISTPLLFHLISQAEVIQDMHFMLQKEVVERIVAQPGTAAYGRLSVMLQYFCKVEKLFVVKSGAFNPPPKVDSAVIRLTPYQALTPVVNNLELFALVVRTAFSYRRKTLHNALKSLLALKQLVSLNVDPEQRPERVSIEEYIKIANHLSEKLP